MSGQHVVGQERTRSSHGGPPFGVDLYVIHAGAIQHQPMGLLDGTAGPGAPNSSHRRRPDQATVRGSGKPRSGTFLGRDRQERSPAHGVVLI